MPPTFSDPDHYYWASRLHELAERKYWRHGNPGNDVAGKREEMENVTLTVGDVHRLLRS